MLSAAADLRAQNDPITHVELNSVDEGLSNTWYYVLTLLGVGKAQKIVMNVDPGSGLEAWRRFFKEFEPAVPGRFKACADNF